MTKDWRGTPNLTHITDFYSIFWTHQARPVLGNPNGRVLVSFAPTILFDVADVASTSPFNAEFYAAAVRRNAMTDLEVWRDTGTGQHTKLVDMTCRCMVSDVLKLIAAHFPWAEGIHHDYFTAWSWLFPQLAPLDDAWDRALAGLASGLRATGKLVLAQQFQLTAPTMAANGLFLEQYPEQFGQSRASHAADLASFRNVLAVAHDPREVLWVAEVRDPSYLTTIYGAFYLGNVKAWADANNFVLSVGEDATAGQTL
jgi:hypothetical protein